MALRDELPPKKAKVHNLIEWVEAQPNADEWRDLLLDEEYSCGAIARLIRKYGLTVCTHNTVFRYREKHASQ